MRVREREEGHTQLLCMCVYLHAGALMDQHYAARPHLSPTDPRTAARRKSLRHQLAAVVEDDPRFAVLLPPPDADSAATAAAGSAATAGSGSRSGSGSSSGASGIYAELLSSRTAGGGGGGAGGAGAGAEVALVLDELEAAAAAGQALDAVPPRIRRSIEKWVQHMGPVACVVGALHCAVVCTVCENVAYCT